MVDNDVKNYNLSFVLTTPNNICQGIIINENYIYINNDSNDFSYYNSNSNERDDDYQRNEV